jgi:hypothetical protein
MITPTVPAPAVPSAPSAPPRPAPAPSRPGTAAITAARKALAASAMSDAVWVPMISAILVLAAGALSLATKRPWLIASLGPSAMLLASNPGHPTTRFHAIVLGHLTAFVSAWLALLLMGASQAPALGADLSPARVWAGAFAIALAAVVQPSLKAYHPPAAATALLVTLGVHKPTMKNSVAMLGGVLLVAVLGEWFQRVRLQQRRAAGV